MNADLLKDLGHLGDVAENIADIAEFKRLAAKGASNGMALLQIFNQAFSGNQNSSGMTYQGPTSIFPF